MPALSHVPAHTITTIAGITTPSNVMPRSNRPIDVDHCCHLVRLRPERPNH